MLTSTVMAKMGAAEKNMFYREKLDEHRHILSGAIKGMSEGDLLQAFTIAITIRVLIHETGRSIPLLKNLKSNYLDLQVYDFAVPPPDPSLRYARKTTIMALPFALRLTEGKRVIAIRPELEAINLELRTLGMWWTRKCLIMPGCTPLSRREVVLGIAHQEAAHVDDDMPKAYKDVLESKGLAVRFGENDIEVVNVTRLVCGTAGVQLLDCLSREFPASASSRVPGSSNP